MPIVDREQKIRKHDIGDGLKESQTSGETNWPLLRLANTSIRQQVVKRVSTFPKQHPTLKFTITTFSHHLPRNHQLKNHRLVV
jgi:hypothetical protein